MYLQEIHQAERLGCRSIESFSKQYDWLCGAWQRNAVVAATIAVVFLNLWSFSFGRVISRYTGSVLAKAYGERGFLGYPTIFDSRNSPVNLRKPQRRSARNCTRCHIERNDRAYSVRSWWFMLFESPCE